SNQMLEHRNAELQKFAFIASHDLQEPLRKIQIFSDMIVEKYAGDRDSTQTFTRKIIASAERMRRLINDLLTYSRVSAKDLFRPTDVNEIIDEVIQDYELQIKARNATFQVDSIPTLDAIPGQIRQVFLNLIGNALKFAKESKAAEVVVTAELVATLAIDAPADLDGKFCRIQVSDNGVGFQQVYADKIFEIFQRLNHDEPYEGTGIGLAIVKKIIDAHNGVIAACGTEGQ